MKKLLVVEDDIDLLNIYIEELEDAGFEVDTAINGLIALEKAVKNTYDFILADINMPKMSGIEFLTELTNQIKEIPPAILVTGNCKYEEVDFPFELKKLFLKPVDLDDLLDFIESAA